MLVVGLAVDFGRLADAPPEAVVTIGANALKPTVGERIGPN